MAVSMPDPNEEDVEWAYYLWNSLSQDNGKWVLPGVGVYRRTGEKTLTLTEIHFAKPNKNEFGQSVFDRHHWIMVLGDNIGWTIDESVESAKDEDGELNIPEELIGHVSVCSARCGAILRVERAIPSEIYEVIGDDLKCPCCQVEQVIEPILKGVHVIVDDRGWQLQQEREEERLQTQNYGEPWPEDEDEEE